MRFLTRIPLTARVPLIAAVLMIVLGMVASQQVLATLNRVQQSRVREIAQLHVEALSVALGPLVLRDDVWEVYDTLSRAAGNTDGRRMVFTAVADETGRVMAATEPARAPLDSPISDLARGAERPDDLTLIDDALTVRLVAPLVYQGREVGSILTELDVSDLAAARRAAGRLLLLGNAAATGILALLGYLVMRRMLRPVARLARRMDETADRLEPVPGDEIPSGDPELARLMQTYNRMAESVEAKRETERRLAERERFVSLGRLSSSLAHEINNPLGGLLNAADTIYEYADRPQVVRQSAQLLTRGLNHLRDVSRAALDQNRVDRSGAVLRMHDFEDLRLLVGPEVNRQAQRLDWSVTAGEEALAGLAAGPVRQIALNLLINATEAAGKGGAVRLDVSVADRTLHIAIADDGPGLSPDARSRLLSSDPLPPGGGVGLRLVHDLVAELGGAVTVERDGGWTVIDVRLPLASVQRGAAC